MFRRCLCILLATFSLLSVGAFACFAKTEISISDLNICRKIAAYSGNFSAFFYGIRDQRLYSFRMLPTRQIRCADLNMTICAVSHDETNAYALCRDSDYRYAVCKMNVATGSCTTQRLPTNRKLYHTMFAAADGEVFVVTDGTAYSYVIGFCGTNSRNYTFSDSVLSLFVNSGSVYASLSNGDIYRLKNGEKSYCCSIGRGHHCFSAGAGYIYSDEKRLVSLSSGVSAEAQGFSAMVNDTVVQPGKVKLFASAGDSYAVMYENGSCVVESVHAPLSDDYSAPVISDGVLKIAAGRTVTDLKNAFSSVSAIYDGSGASVTSGKLKTGFSVLVSGQRYDLVVPGDLSANGQIGNADVSILMRHFSGKQVISGNTQKAADYNSDGAVNNKDLLLISRLV